MKKMNEEKIRFIDLLKVGIKNYYSINWEKGLSSNYDYTISIEDPNIKVEIEFDLDLEDRINNYKIIECHIKLENDPNLLKYYSIDDNSSLKEIIKELLF